ncbi:MAG: glucans biosynthesis glucosyltransferase MdoH [Pseudomonadota bacterium]
MSQTVRRYIFAGLVFSTMACLGYVMFSVLSEQGFSLFEYAMFACFLITLPWTVIGFWNAFIGFLLLRFTKKPAAYVFPGLDAISDNEAIETSTAIAMCVRNEEVDQVYRNLNAMIARLVTSGHADKFHVYILSDSSFPEIIAEESPAFERLKRSWHNKIEITYRRRETNPGFKAGNIGDFCDRWGHKHDYMLTLDADSVMSASAILRMVRLMQKNEKLGILQSLVVGLPSESGFTRAFQFGMRLGMKSYTLGSAWWQADCGPYWGHNAIIRLAPFMEHCNLPQLPGSGPLSGWVLSHDQVEAAFMRRGGYECRVLAEEGGSYEENPPHVLEFIRRDLRWCHGNMQYFRLLKEKNLHPTSRVQLVLAILMFIGSPAWMTFVVLATLSCAFPEWSGVVIAPGGLGMVLFATIMTMIFAPKIASFLDTMMNRELRKQFGGAPRIVFSWFTEIFFSIMLAPIMAIANTIFLFRLFILRKANGWIAQARSVEALPVSRVAKHLWPQMIFGVAGITILVSVQNVSVAGLLIALPVFMGPFFALPFGVSSAKPIIGFWAAKMKIWQIPEEAAPPVIIRALHLPALSAQNLLTNGDHDHVPLTTEQLLSFDVNE